MRWMETWHSRWHDWRVRRGPLTQTQIASWMAERWAVAPRYQQTQPPLDAKAARTLRHAHRVYFAQRRGPV